MSQFCGNEDETEGVEEFIISLDNETSSSRECLSELSAHSANSFAAMKMRPKELKSS